MSDDPPRVGRGPAAPVFCGGSVMLRPDKKPFVFDNRNVTPRYVIESNEADEAVLINQFSGESAVIGPRPYSKQDVRKAYMKLKRGDKT